MRALRQSNSLALESCEKDGLSFLRAPVLIGRPGLEHAFMTKVGGVSPPPFNALNFGGDDEVSNIRANMGRLGRVFGLPPAGVATVAQVHGNHVVVMDRKPDPAGGRPEGDAIITAKRGLPIGILTADCVPVLFFDEKGGTIAAAHAGWRGFVAGVLRQTISAMSREFGSRSGDILAAIGPHIGPCCYEVSADIIERFSESGRETAPYFRQDKRIRLDLGRAVFDELIACGLEAGHISRPGPCTSCDRAGFYSYRRDGTTGRQLSFIMMR